MDLEDLKEIFKPTLSKIILTVIFCALAIGSIFSFFFLGVFPSNLYLIINFLFMSIKGFSDFLIRLVLLIVLISIFAYLISCLIEYVRKIVMPEESLFKLTLLKIILTVALLVLFLLGISAYMDLSVSDKVLLFSGMINIFFMLVVLPTIPLEHVLGPFSFIIGILLLYFYSCLIVLFIRAIKFAIEFVKEKIENIEWDIRKIAAVCVAILIVGVGLYCFFSFGRDIFTPTADDKGWTKEGVQKIVDANNQFAFKLYLELTKSKQGNIFFSPWSISNAMAIVYEGARGKTADEIKSVFNFPENDSERRASFARELNVLNKGGGKYELHIANALWAQKDYRFLDEYKEIAKRYYIGELENVDFRNPATVGKINNWVASKTNDKIKDIIGSLDPVFTKLVVTNAIYFKGKWEYQFDKKKTKNDEFKLLNGQTKIMPMMNMRDGKFFNYSETADLQILEMGYQGGKLSMLILLPKSNDIKSVESQLSVENLKKWRSEMKSHCVFIKMPKFKFETGYQLNDILSGLGMPTAFKWPGADFSGMDGTEKLFIKDVVHKAYIDVYEEGTEAAAATVIVMEMGAASAPECVIFNADHPFIFMIQETETGNILFMGRFTGV